MKILVLGAGGMAGHVVSMGLLEKGHEVIGLARRKLPFCQTVSADARNIDMLRDVIHGGNFDAVINCIGILNKAVDADPYNGIWLNSCLPHLLVTLTEGMKTRVIHLSSDCVFSGYEGGGYSEKSFRSADTLYGRSKSLGEIIDAQNLTLRTSIVGPDVSENGVGLFNWFMQQKDTVSGYTDAIWTGVTTITLAEATDAALKQNLTGLYHLTNGKKIDKFTLLRLFNGLREQPVAIMPSDTVKEDRSLVNTRRDFDFVVPTYAEMVARMGKWITKSKYLYPQYKLGENLL